jgi:predicted outer membrane repeat protein
VINCTLSDNTAEGGAGIYTGNLLTVINSTFSGNNAESGGGILCERGTVNVINSTHPTAAASSSAATR